MLCVCVYIVEENIYGREYIYLNVSNKQTQHRKDKHHEFVSRAVILLFFVEHNIIYSSRNYIEVDCGVYTKKRRRKFPHSIWHRHCITQHIINNIKIIQTSEGCANKKFTLCLRGC